MKILIVDDNELVRRGVSTLLSSQHGWQVCGQAEDGDEAIRKAKELHPDVILLDISMPGASGLEVAAILRREIPSAKIVIMSQHDQAQILPRAIEAGADACVNKDNLGMDLLPTIESLIGRSDAQFSASVS